MRNNRGTIAISLLVKVGIPAFIILVGYLGLRPVASHDKPDPNRGSVNDNSDITIEWQNLKIALACNGQPEQTLLNQLGHPNDSTIDHVVLLNYRYQGLDQSEARLNVLALASSPNEIYGVEFLAFGHSQLTAGRVWQYLYPAIKPKVFCYQPDPNRPDDNPAYPRRGVAVLIGAVLYEGPNDRGNPSIITVRMVCRADIPPAVVTPRVDSEFTRTNVFDFQVNPNFDWRDCLVEKVMIGHAMSNGDSNCLPSVGSKTYNWCQIQ